LLSVRPISGRNLKGPEHGLHVAIYNILFLHVDMGCGSSNTADTRSERATTSKQQTTEVNVQKKDSSTNNQSSSDLNGPTTHREAGL
jgi:hypothetical protein